MKKKNKKIKISEKSIQEEITWQLKGQGWLVLRLPPSIYSSKGLPDLLALKGDKYLLIEVKSTNGKLSQSQQCFKLLMEDIKANYVVARCYEDVEEFLKRIGAN